MGRLRSAVAVLPALLPGACVVLLAFQAGGFYPDSWAPLAVLAALALAVRVAVVERPFAGISPWSAVAAAALALLGAWILLSAQWSHAPGRALVEFGRLLAYLLVFLLCAAPAPRARRLAWALRGVALAIGVVCVAGLATRLRPDLWHASGLLAGRLDYPISYWNGLGMLAAVGGVLGLHLSGSDREPWPVRVTAAALPPVAACTVYFTLSRGGIAAGAIGVAAYLALGFSRATPGALLALVPTTVIAVARAYDAGALVTPDYAGAAGLAQGRSVANTLALAVLAAVALRGFFVPMDRRLAEVPGPGRLSPAARAGAAATVVLAVAAAGLAFGAPAWADRQVNTFLSSSPAPTGRQRLTSLSNNGRLDHWNVALDAWRAAPVHGSGAGTYQNLWNRDRPSAFQVLDAHSLYVEVLGELGVVGLTLLLVAVGTIVAGLAWRLRRPNRPAAAAALAATLAWALHAGVDWDWELAAVTIWVFGVAGIALAGPPRPERAAAAAEQGAVAAGAARPPMPGLLRVVVALGCLILALSPFNLWRSQVHLRDAVRAFRAGDCPRTIDASLDSLEAVAARADPWELIAYCDYRLGQPQLAIGAARAAVARDPDDWEYRYAEALILGALGRDPRPAAAEALRLNPLQPEARAAARTLHGSDPALWQRRARRLPLYLH